jgi:hypothetical protein
MRFRHVLLAATSAVALLLPVERLLVAATGDAMLIRTALADKGSGKGGGGSDDSGGGSSGSSDDGGSDDDSGGDDGGSGNDGGDDDSGTGSDNSDHGSDDSGDDDDEDSGSSGDGSDDSGDDGDEDSGSSGHGGDDSSDDDHEGDDRSGSGNSTGSSGGAASSTGYSVVSESRGHEIVPGEVLGVDLSASAIRQALQEGFTLRQQRGLTSLGIVVTSFGAPPGVSVEAARQRLQELAPSRPVSLHDAYELQDGSACSGDRCWAQAAVGWNPESTSCGAGRRIGMVDTAINAREPGLARSRVVQRSFTPGASAPASHGTAIAGLIVGQGPEAAGLLPAAELLGADVFGRERDGKPRAGALEIAAALDWLSGERVDVINMSLAGPANAVLEAAVSAVRARGITIVAAAGNNGPGSPPVYPAAYPGVIAVTGVDRDRQVYRKANHGDYIAFSAPGVDVEILDGKGTAVRSGTSYATPFVAAAVAALGDVDAQTMEAALAKHVIDLGAPGRDPVFGWGLVQIGGSCGRSTA